MIDLCVRMTDTMPFVEHENTPAMRLEELMVHAIGFVRSNAHVDLGLGLRKLVLRIRPFVCAAVVPDRIELRHPAVDFLEVK